MNEQSTKKIAGGNRFGKTAAAQSTKDQEPRTKEAPEPLLDVRVKVKQMPAASFPMPYNDCMDKMDAGTKLTARHVAILQHALGVDEYGKGRQYRNHFVTGPGCSDFQLCEDLVEMGCMVKQSGGGLLCEGNFCYQVTESGRRLMRENSPLPPPEKKMTRSQRRYRRWLDAGCVMSFIEFVRVITSRDWIERHGKEGC